MNSLMKILSLFTAFFLFNAINNINAQSTFSKILPQGVNDGSRMQNAIIYNDTFYTRTIINGDLEINVVDINGNIVKNKKLHWLNNVSSHTFPNRIMIDKHGDLIISGNYQNKHCLLKLSRNLDSLWSHTYTIPGATFVADNSILETDDGLVLQGQAQFGDPSFYAYLFWISKDRVLDTLIVHKEINEIGQIQSGHISLDMDGNLVFMYNRLFRDPDFPLWGENQRGFLKYNKNKRVFWQWESVGLKDDTNISNFSIDESNNLIFVDFTEIGIKKPSLFCLSPEKQILWEQKVLVAPGMMKYIYRLAKHDGGYLLNGYHHLYDSVATLARNGYIAKISNKGDLLWERSYREYLGEDKLGPNNAKTFNVAYSELSALIVDEDNNIYGFGGYSNITEASQHSWIVKVDEFGCFSKDKCSDVVEVVVEDYVTMYDQLNLKQKSFYYQSQSLDESPHNHMMYFGIDTIMFDPKLGNNVYKKVFYEDSVTGEITEDKRRVRWSALGYAALAVSDTRPGYFWAYDQRLYDFKLKVGDRFQLPDSFGIAVVASVDEFVFNDGGIRKKITLKHENVDNQNAYGDLIWVEGIGALNAPFFYYDDWKNKSKSFVTCYFDRGMKKYHHEQSLDCRVSSTENATPSTKIFLYPNPSSDIIYLVNPSNDDLSHVDIFDIAGKYKGQKVIENNQIDILSLQSGMYMVKIYEGKNLISNQKIIKF